MLLCSKSRYTKIFYICNFYQQNLFADFNTNECNSVLPDFVVKNFAFKKCVVQISDFSYYKTILWQCSTEQCDPNEYCDIR